MGMFGHSDSRLDISSDNGSLKVVDGNTRFGDNGRNVSGPPPRPLEAYDVHVRGEEVIVNRRRGT